MECRKLDSENISNKNWKIRRLLIEIQNKQRCGLWNVEKQILKVLVIERLLILVIWDKQRYGSCRELDTENISNKE